MRELAVVDADSHVTEPMSAWAALRDEQRPRIRRDEFGLEHVYVGDTLLVIGSLGNIATPGAKMSDLAGARPFEEAEPGGFDPVIHLRAMDSEGIDAAVMYPTVGLNFWAITDAPAAVSLARAYNDWLAEYCSTDPHRMYGAAMVPLQDPTAAAAELRRAHDELGFRVAFVRPNPVCGRSISDPSHEIVWETAENLGVTIGVHEGSSNTIPTLGTDRMITPFILHAVSHAFEQMLACAQLMCFGVMERHPELHFVFLEAGGGWAPYWMERLDEQVYGFGAFNPDMKLRPSDYFARQCWIPFEPDERTLPALAPLIEDRAMWGSDYPHHDSTFPGAVKEIRETIGALSPDLQRKILGDNALACYRLA
jgi:predicted TIM-barrel fold metal-dependent hydrolase